MGLFELLDYACAVLTEAGYSDVWSWTPRQIVHRLDVHNRLAAKRRLVDLETGLMAFRGDEKALQKFVQQAESLASPRAARGGDHSVERNPRPPADRAARFDEELKKVGWA